MTHVFHRDRRNRGAAAVPAPYAVTSFVTSEPAEHLADLVASDAPAGRGRVWFTFDGSETVECP